MKYQDIREKEVENKARQEVFSKFDCTNILGKIDLTLSFF